MKLSCVKPILFFCTVVLSVAAPAADVIELPFNDNFPSATLEAGWKSESAPGSKVEVKDGWITFEELPGARNHILRPAGKDLITVSAQVVRWSGIYLVWDANNWCGVGKNSPTPFGRFYSIDFRNGKPTEVDHRGIDFNFPHEVRIQLGRDHIRFQYLKDGKWLDLRTIERTKEFSGTPKWIALGKYYGSDDRPFGDVDLKPSPEEKISGAIREFHVELTPANQLKLSRVELNDVRNPPAEPVGAVLTQSDEDPSFQKIVGYYPPMVHPREIVGVPAHPLDIGVDRLGRLDVSPWTPPLAWFEVGNPARPLGEEGLPFRRRLLHGYIPVITLNRTVGSADCELTAFGWSQDFSVDKDLMAYVRFSAHVTGTNSLPQSFTMLWENGGKHVFPLSTVDGNQATCCFCFKYPKPASVTELSSHDFDSRENEVVAFWKKKIAPAEKFEIPDARVAEGYRAWLVYSMLNADTINGFIEPHDGAGFYEEMFGCSVSMHTEALDNYGMPDYATQILDTQIHYQQTNGLYTQACGLTDPGAFLVGLARHFTMTNDREWFRRVAPSTIKQCNWLLEQRKVAPKDGPMRGLIKFRPYNDYQYPVFNYLGNSWCARGMELAAKALTQNGFTEGDQYLAEAKQYQKDVLDSMEVSTVQLDGQTVLPMEPDTHRLLKMSKYRGGDYYGLVASSLLETELLPPNDKRATWIVDALEKRGGLIAGVSEFEKGIDHAYAYGYLMNEMKREETRKTLLGFWSFLAFGMTRDTYSPVEVTMIATGENHYTLPHLYSCTEQLRLLRNLLVREDNNVLWIGQGIPRAWLETGKHITVTSAPTEFGNVSYRMDPQPDGTMRVSIDPPSRQSPGEIRVRLRDPQHRRIASVNATGLGETSFSGETIVLRNVKSPLDLQVSFAK